MDCIGTIVWYEGSHCLYCGHNSNDVKHQIYDIYPDQCTLTINTPKMVLFFGMRRPNYLLSSILFKQQHNPLHFCSVKHGLGFSSLLIIFQMF